MVIEVTYMSGAGNLFSVIDNRKYYFSVQILMKLAPVLCSVNKLNNKYTEGLIALRNGNGNLSFQSDFINPDGSFGAMCGNGGRCAVNFAYKSGLFKNIDEKIKFSMAGNVYESIFHSSEHIELFFPPPIEIRRKINLRIEKKDYWADYVNVGSDHIIIDYDKITEFDNVEFREFDINEFARPIRYHDDLKPRGANVNIYRIIDGIVHLRTYERGVEAETGACGTGAISVAIIISESYNLRVPLLIIPPSREELEVDIIRNSSNEIISVVLSGNARITETAEINIPENLLKS